MANKDITFVYDPNLTLHLFPDERYELSLDDWNTHQRPSVQQASPNLGRYDATIDDTYRFWMVFIGATQPVNWSQWELTIDADPVVVEVGVGVLTAENFSDSALAKINQIRR